MILGRKPTDFTPLESLTGDEKFYTQTLSDSFQATLPAIGDYMDFYINGDKTTQQGTYLVSGGRVVWESGLTFTVTAAVYYINGIRYTSEESQVTLDAADPSNPRIDTFYLDTDTAFGAITGTPAATPAEPSIDPETQIRLTIATINAGATTPAGVSNGIIYNENVGVAGGEWDTSVNVGGYVTFEDTTDPAKDTKSIKTSVFEINTLTLRFTNNATVNLSDYDSLVMRIRQRGRIARNQTIQIYWSDTIGMSYTFNPSLALKTGEYGFNSPNEEWQTVVIPIASFTPYEANRDASRLSIGIPSRSGTLMWEFDDIFLQAGINQTTNTSVDVKVGKSIFVDTVYGDDTTGERENFIKPFATAAAAEAVAQAGDTIVFRPGTHIISNLGKNLVTYYGMPGSILQGNGNADMWRDNNVAIRYDIVADVITTANGRWFYNLNASTVIHVEANEMYQTSFSTSKDAIYGRGIYYINVKNTVDVNADNWYLIQQESNGIIYFVGNHVKVRTRIANTNAGRIYYKANYSQSYSTNANENSFGANGGGYVYIQDTYIRADNGVANYTGVIAPESGTIELVGCRIECTSTVRAPIDIGHAGNAGGVVIMRNCVVEYETTANLPIVQIRSNTNNKLIAYNTEFINLNTTSAAHGIRTENTNANGSIELKDCVIKLDSTAVGAGAKAIAQQSGTLSYKMMSDILSNGAFDGTNLIASTAAIVDPNVKSD